MPATPRPGIAGSSSAAVIYPTATPSPTLAPASTPAPTTTSRPKTAPRPTPTSTAQSMATPAPTPTATPGRPPTATPAPALWRTYRNEEDGYETQVPVHWEVQEDPNSALFMDPDRNVYISVGIYTDPPGPPGEWIEIVMDNANADPPEVLGILEPLTKSANGPYKLATISFRHGYGSADCVSIVRHLIIASAEQSYSIAAGYCADYADAQAAEVERFLGELNYWK